MSHAPDPIGTFLTPLFGTYSWGAVRVHGSILMLEFGDPNLTVSKPHRAPVHLEGVSQHMLQRKVFVRGQWTLTIYLSVWSLVCEDVEIATSSSDQPRVERAVRVLAGQALREVDLRPDGTTFFRFDLGGVLGVWPAEEGIYSDGSLAKLWSLLGPGVDALEVRADGQFSIHPRNTEPDSYVWQPIPNN